jgi:hypothetical protein
VPGAAGNAGPAPLGHQVAVPAQVPAPFIVKLAGIAEAELEQRAVRITEMGNSPLEDEETRKAKSFALMNALWDRAGAIVAESGESLATRMQAAGKEFSEFNAKAVIFMNLLAQRVLNPGCVSCQVSVGDNQVSRFFPIEIMEKEKASQRLDAVTKFLRAVKDVPLELPDVKEVIRKVHSITLKELSEDYLSEQDREVDVYSAIDWCAPKLVLRPDNLKRVIGECGRSYVKYQEAIRERDGTALFDQYLPTAAGPQAPVPQQQLEDVGSFLANLDFSYIF